MDNINNKKKIIRGTIMWQYKLIYTICSTVLVR